MADTNRSTRERGRSVEQFVRNFLESNGLEVLESNFEAAGAEVDLVGKTFDGDEEVFVFVEIRSRGGDERGTPLETIDRRKQRRVIRAATAWLVNAGLWDKVTVRFDAVGVIDGDDGPVDVQWVRGAFEAS